MELDVEFMENDVYERGFNLLIEIPIVNTSFHFKFVLSISTRKLLDYLQRLALKGKLKARGSVKVDKSVNGSLSGSKWEIFKMYIYKNLIIK